MNHGNLGRHCLESRFRHLDWGGGGGSCLTGKNKSIVFAQPSRIRQLVCFSPANLRLPSVPASVSRLPLCSCEGYGGFFNPADQTFHHRLVKDLLAVMAGWHPFDSSLIDCSNETATMSMQGVGREGESFPFRERERKSNNVAGMLLGIFHFF